MTENAGVYSYLTAIALLVIIAFQLAMVLYWLRRIHEALTQKQQSTGLPPEVNLREPYPYHDLGPHSPFFGHSTDIGH